VSNRKDENRIRLQEAIAGFAIQQGRWPKRVRIRPVVVANVRAGLFLEEAFGKLVGRVACSRDEQGTFNTERDGEEYNMARTGSCLLGIRSMWPPGSASRLIGTRADPTWQQTGCTDRQELASGSIPQTGGTCWTKGDSNGNSG
jgi:hypothetical protein